MKLSLLIIILSVFSLNLFGQVEIDPQITPDFFSASEDITITYNVTGTELSSLDETWLWLWLPDQSGVNPASNINPASSNASATDPAKFTKTTSGGFVEFSITINLSDFTGLDPDQISEVGMLIKGNDWSDGQSTDYVTEITEGFTLILENPDGNYGFYNSTQNLNILAKTSSSASIEILIDDVIVITQSNITEMEFTHEVIVDGQVHTIKVSASDGSETLESSYSYTSTPVTSTSTLPTGMLKGINYHESDPTKATLVLEAPEKEFVFAIGDFNNWQLSNEHLLVQDGDLFWVTLEGLTPGQEYVFQYLIDGNILIADPYTDKVSDPWDDKDIDNNRYPGLIDYPESKTEYRAGVLQTNQQPYEWQTTDFVKPDADNLVVYELLVRDFTDERTYQGVVDKLDYLEELGVNAIELMPINEFEGNLSWGYNPNFYFAPDKYYGTKNELKALIDECHNRGIAVLIDLVLNHSYGSSPLVRMYWNESGGRPASNNPWYNEEHNFTNPDAHWGNDFNHESPYTQAFIDSVNHYWISEYKVDGFRYDFTKGFGNRTKSSSDPWGSLYDGDRIRLLKRMVDKVWEVDPEAYVIFEHLAENSEEKELADYGIMLWGNMNHSYRSLAKGNSSSLANVYHDFRGWSDPNLVGYMESHDEERVAWDMFKTIDYQLGIQRLKLNAAFFLTVPGPKMVWQFGEIGYDEELNNNRLGIKPTHWEYIEDSERLKLYQLYSSLINFKTKSGLMDDQYFSWSSSQSIKYINIEHPDASIVVVGNFGTSGTTTNAHFTKNGTWYDYFTEETIEVTDFATHEINLIGSEFRIFTSEQIDNYTETNPNDFILGTDNEISITLNAYPNPVQSVLNVTDAGNSATFKLYDLKGKVILKGSMEVNQINMHDVSNGIYVLEYVSSSGRMKRNKIIKN